MKKEILETIINNRQIQTVFQPIISLKDGQVMGYEALSRFWYEEEMIQPLDLFKIAKRHKKEWALELLCRSNALEAAYSLGFMSPPKELKLFINVSPSMLQDEVKESNYTATFLDQRDLPHEAVAFEITEREQIVNSESFSSMVEHYKHQHFSIAIDDVGAGYSGLNLISDLKPNYIKLDMRLIRNVDTDYIKSAMVRSMVEFSNISSARIIAEGVETFEELEALIHLGVHYAQGFFIQRPASTLVDISKSTLDAIKIAQVNKN